MDEQKVHKSAIAKTIKKKGSDTIVILIHGYTGSVADFQKLPPLLSSELNADVICPRLPGHGTKFEDLNNLEYEDFYEHVKIILKKHLGSGKKIILGGYSFGSYLAMNLAGEYEVDGVFTLACPWKLRFPFNIPGIKYLRFFKPYWKKRLSKDLIEIRKERFFYDKMHIKGYLSVIKAKQIIKKISKNIKCPALFFHFKKDSIGHYKGDYYIKNMINNNFSKCLLIKDNPLHIHPHDVDYQAEFIVSNLNNFINKSKEKDKVTAVVPAFFEEKTISQVIDTLENCRLVDEIIVIDDGSTDNTYKNAKSSVKSKTRVIRNSINMGKAYSMEKGVNLSNGNIIFFCDADLIGLNSNDISEIIKPVLENKTDMCIGIRKNLMQTLVKSFAINSGERALRKDIWDRLPKYYKHRYRIECGLNLFVRIFGTGYELKYMDYKQILKEKKLGLLKGTYWRWKMNWDVISAWFRFNLFDRWKRYQYFTS